MELVLFLMFVGALWVAPIFFAHRWGKRFSISHAWLWGLFLGWIGFFVVVAISTKRMTTRDGLEKVMGKQTMEMSKNMLQPFEGARKTCPDCAESVQEAATICKHCGHSFAAPPLGAPTSP